jgi:hypothetical protein
MTLLEVKFCTHEAAKYAVQNWHYSKILPWGKLVKFGVWEDKKFIGTIIFSRGASPYLGNFLKLDATEICELTRVALDKHKSEVTKILAIALKNLKILNPKLKAVISFADPKEGHKGGIYQAGNWIYTGKSNEVTEYFIKGRWRQTRGVYYYPERKTAPNRVVSGKFRYIYPLEKTLRRSVVKLALPYPHAVEGLEESRNDSIVKVQVRSLPTALKEVTNG